MSEGRRCQSPKRSGASGRGSEHGAGLVYAPRRAAQAGLTGGADRSSRLRRETNVVKKDQPKAEPKTREFSVLRALFVSVAVTSALPSATVLCVGKMEAAEIRADWINRQKDFHHHRGLRIEEGCYSVLSAVPSRPP